MSEKPNLDSLFEEAISIDSPEMRERFIRESCGDDQELRRELGVPVGIIECAWGGKPVEAFTSMEALKALPEAKGVVEKRAKAEATWDPKKAAEQFEKQKAAYDAKLKQWQKDKKGKKPRGPRKPTDPGTNPSLASTIFNGMIAPIAGYGARGAIWASSAPPAQGKNWERKISIQMPAAGPLSEIRGGRAEVEGDGGD